jgi:hypothetical protein
MCRFQFIEVGSQASVRTAQSCVWMPINIRKFQTIQGCIHPNVSAMRPDAHQCSTRNQISFSDTDMERQLQLSRS